MMRVVVVLVIKAMMTQPATLIRAKEVTITTIMTTATHPMIPTEEAMFMEEMMKAVMMNLMIAIKELTTTKETIIMVTAVHLMMTHKEEVMFMEDHMMNTVMMSHHRRNHDKGNGEHSDYEVSVKINHNHNQDNYVSSEAQGRHNNRRSGNHNHYDESTGPHRANYKHDHGSAKESHRRNIDGRSDKYSHWFMLIEEVNDDRSDDYIHRSYKEKVTTSQLTSFPPIAQRKGNNYSTGPQRRDNNDGSNKYSTGPQRRGSNERI